MRVEPYLVTMRATSTLVVEACDPASARLLALYGYGAGLGAEPHARPLRLSDPPGAANEGGKEADDG